MRRAARPALWAITLALAAAAPAAASAASLHLYAYDPANASTREAAGGVTFEFSRQMVFNTVLSLHSTFGQANAPLKPVSESVLGGGGLSPLIGANAPERDLYEVLPEKEGAALVAALCPGSKRGFMSFGRLRMNKPLRVHVLGDNPAGGPARLCRTLDFTFRGEWRMPDDSGPADRDVKRPTFPY